jgi:heme-degrading monooxygenase HmoA
MRGTNSGPFNGLPPTGREIALPGADFITFADDGWGIASVTGYFDSARVPRDLGLDVIVQPTTIGPWTFGVASRASAGREAPAGAISLTFLEARSAEEVEEVRTRSREIVHELLDAPGFISFVGVTVGRRMYTISAWETPEAARGIRGNAGHREAVARMFGPQIASAGQTGIWAPWRLNEPIVRCTQCDTMVRAADVCACGATLPAAAAF